MRLITALLVVVLAATTAAARQMSIEADRVERPAPNIYIADGNVFVFSDNATISADHVRLDRNVGTAEASGSVTISMDGDVIRADSARIDMTNRRITADNVTGYAAPYYYYTAKTLEQTGELSFSLEDARFSTCAGETPDWSFSTGSANITVGGYFSATNTTANIKKLPIMYMPWFIYPVKTERESGLLIPNISFSSSKGFTAPLRYYQNLGIDMDATVGLTHYDLKGQMAGLEYRYAISQRERVYLAFDYLDDRHSDADVDQRWRAYSSTAVDITDSLRFTLSADYVSDWLFLRDFTKHSMASEFDETDSSKTTHYAEAALSLTTPPSNISIRRRADTEYADTDTGYRRTTVERVGNLRLTKNFPRMSFIRMNYRVDIDKIRRTRKDFNATGTNAVYRREHDRYNARLRLYRPFDLKVATLTPYITGYWTKWANTDTPFNVTESDLGGWRSLQIDDNGDVTRKLYVVGYTLSLNEIYRSYASFRHSIYNRITYARVPRLPQSGIPDLVEADVISYTDEYTYNLTNYFKASRWNAKAVLAQTYDQTRDENRLDPVVGRIDVNIGKYFAFNAREAFDHYGDGTTYRSVAASVTTGLLTFRDRYLFDESESQNNTSHAMAVTLNLPRLRIQGETSSVGRFGEPRIRGLDSRERSISIVYLADCWEFGLGYEVDRYNVVTADGTRREDERTISLEISLRGLGGSSNTIASY